LLHRNGLSPITL